MKICIIGNSHAGMLIKSLADAPQDDMTCQFFAAPGTGPDVFTIEPSGVLSTRDPGLIKQFATYGMPASVDLAACDLIAVVAMTTTLFHIKPLLGDHLVFGWPGSRAALGGTGPDRPQLLSEAALCAGLVARIRAGLAHRYVTAIRAGLAVPIVLVREPTPSESVFDTAGKHPFLKRAATSGDALACLAVLTQAHQAAFAGFDNLIMLDQPLQSLTAQGLTRRSYTTGAVRLNTRFAQPDTDVMHANAVYGGVVWQQIRAIAAAIR